MEGEGLFVYVSVFDWTSIGKVGYGMGRTGIAREREKE